MLEFELLENKIKNVQNVRLAKILLLRKHGKHHNKKLFVMQNNTVIILPTEKKKIERDISRLMRKSLKSTQTVNSRETEKCLVDEKLRW